MTTVKLPDALRMLIGVQDPKLADRVTSLEAVHAMQSGLEPVHRPGEKPRFKSLPPDTVREAEAEIVLGAHHDLYSAVRQGRVRLRGCLDNALSANIDPTEQEVGELNIWKETLTVGKRVYERVRCIKASMDKVVKDAAAGLTVAKQKVPEAIIRKAITDVYDAADKEATKPPNINELPAAVQPLLEALGYKASGHRIKKIGRDKEFADRRREIGSGLPRLREAVSE
jgi:hypothetical protein